MIIKGLVDEDFINYKTPSMYIAFPRCSFKCEKECGEECCQNSAIAKMRDIPMDASDVAKRYIDNPITKSVVLGGLEPLDTLEDVVECVSAIRERCADDIVIYTGYTENEAYNALQRLSQWCNIIVKFGRFIPNQESHFDNVLGVELASPNQYAKRIS